MRPHEKLLRRPNGRPQACDPCRRRKVACDHSHPVCKRCAARNEQPNCTYTVVAVVDRSSKLSGSRRRVPAATPANTSRPASSDLVFSSHRQPLGHGARAYAADAPGSPGPEDRTGAFNQIDGRPGFLGFTSHSTVYAETRSCLSILGFPPWLLFESSDRHHAQLWDDSELRASPARDMWLVVLQSLPTPSVDSIAASVSPRCNDGWVRSAARRVLASLSELFGAHLGPTRSHSRLQQMACFLTANTARPFREDLADPDEWLRQFTGFNLRWESIGLLFSFNEMGTRGCDKDAIEADEWRKVSRVCLGLCIDLSRRFSYGSSLVLLLCLRRTVVESVLAGDASLCCWRYHAESVALMTFLGLHAEPSVAPYRPTLASEHRRRLAARTFSRDKALVVFTGRPPLACRKYVTTPLPLDLSDEDLLADGVALDRAVQSLDSRGWNTKGEVYSATLLRARTVSAVIRDELLEIALGDPQQASIEHLMSLREKQMRSKSEFPLSRMYNARDIADSAVSTSIIYARLLTELDHLQNLFVAERLMLKRGRPDNGELLVISFEMVSLTLTLWAHKDRLADLRRDFEWLLMAYGAPGGGVLCMELLDPTLSGSHPKNPKLHRAGVVQQLSLLAGFLDWVPQSAPNADLCANCKLIIRHVLDHSLNGAGGSVWPPASLDSIQFDFNFEILNTFGLLRPDVRGSGP